MLSRAVLPRILGALFYYSPERPEVKALFDCLPTLPELYPWRDRGSIESLCASWSLPDDDALTWQFSVLFEGQGKMPVPPWGSVYLEKDNLLMGGNHRRLSSFFTVAGHGIH
ncbi:Twin-arginine leader-binding protein DmsD [Salmonella enterica subsp. enterica]|uniref:Twin-arginine leader-binding protein DmsD n=1 Tax=Salmonella enterica I TaxID=59201 RepID=A0A3S4IM25_SALET|nr:Twin-arginine leader-binding protein DmsD [Salmonella enterica subsp. enterica serovar Typhimurium]VEB51257.1 Twin-arginine leader-binding protein DmsD [Salmonella enterica subsp. enterica]